MVSTRFALQLLIALGAAVSARAYWEEDSLDSRELGLYDLEERSSPYALRGYADEDDFVLTRRDLARLGVRAEDISHVLVVRASPTRGRSRSPSPGLTKAQCQANIDKFKAAVKGCEKEMRRFQAEKKKAKTDAEKKKWHREWEASKELRDGNQDEVDAYTRILNSGQCK